MLSNSAFLLRDFWDVHFVEIIQKRFFEMLKPIDMRVVPSLPCARAKFKRLHNVILKSNFQDSSTSHSNKPHHCQLTCIENNKFVYPRQNRTSYFRFRTCSKELTLGNFCYRCLAGPSTAGNSLDHQIKSSIRFRTLVEVSLWVSLTMRVTSSRPILHLRDKDSSTCIPFEVN